MIFGRLGLYLSYLMVGGGGLISSFYLTSTLMDSAMSQEKKIEKKVVQVTAKVDSKAEKKEELSEVEEVLEADLEPLTEDDKVLVEKDLADEVDLGQGLRFDQVGEFNYEPKGLRDPFKPYASEQVYSNEIISEVSLEPLQRFNLEQLELVGMVWDVAKPKVMILDPNGKVHTVKQSAKLGRNNGYIAVVREGEVVVVEKYKDGVGKVSYNTRTLVLNR